MNKQTYIRIFFHVITAMLITTAQTSTLQANDRPRSLLDVDITRVEIHGGSALKFTTLAANKALLAGGWAGVLLNEKLLIAAQYYSLQNKVRPDISKGRLNLSYQGITLGTG